MPPLAKTDSSALLQWGTAIALVAIAFATIGAASKDNKDKIKDLDREVTGNAMLITEIRLQTQRNESKNQTLLSNQEKMMLKIDNLYYSGDEKDK